jgi:hypothetical protein
VAAVVALLPKLERRENSCCFGLRFCTHLPNSWKFPPGSRDIARVVSSPILFVDSLCICSLSAGVKCLEKNSKDKAHNKKHKKLNKEQKNKKNQ